MFDKLKERLKKKKSKYEDGGLTINPKDQDDKNKTDHKTSCMKSSEKYQDGGMVKKKKKC